VTSGLRLGVLDQAVGPAVLVLATLVAVRALVPALATAGRLLPGAAGRGALAAARWLRPGLLRRLLALAIGVAAPATAAVLPAAAAAAHSAAAHPSTTGTGDLATSHVVASAAAAAPVRARPTHRSPRVELVVVRPGDTLWAIARRHLHPGATDAEVARAWPRWYAANRGVIGPDPNLILPGTRLRAPGATLAREGSPRPAGTPAQHHRPASQHVDASSLDPDRR
jgi:nucleoid-associated protein YgaU